MTQSFTSFKEGKDLRTESSKKKGVMSLFCRFHIACLTDNRNRAKDSLCKSLRVPSRHSRARDRERYLFRIVRSETSCSVNFSLLTLRRLSLDIAAAVTIMQRCRIACTAMRIASSSYQDDRKLPSLCLTKIMFFLLSISVTTASVSILTPSIHREHLQSLRAL